MREHFYLIQRGSIRENFLEKERFLSGRQDALIDPDYMGSAEFEWGAIPKAYIRIRYMLEEYELYDTGWFTTAGKKMFLFCNKKYHDNVVEELKRYVKEHYQLKEFSSMPEQFEFIHLTGDKSVDAWHKRDAEFHQKTDFWWCIDINDDDPNYPQLNYLIGDWMAWVIKPDQAEAFNNKIMSIFKADAEELMTREDLDELIKKAKHYP